ncbi:hypothetical protein HRG_000699 [Hirsutella rhossiliensis]|uniref:Uncharacterized protein n=1 Tax=Hirsutella rhossiliensis TaxID=111463 RepID=A0A9P8N6U7_9HYPO|nr:uncharacterized protein HRG_00699 [Hirsutella rhossiliensis]KAH0968057.1 hypothetical protein HRG_00699 [Hirsutella rhossiliensis]
MLRRTPPLYTWPRQLRAQRIARSARHSSSQSPPSQASRIDRITSKLPKRLQKYTTRLRNAPGSHVVAFLILHELTAIAPLVALFAIFHYTTFMPVSYATEHLGENIQSGITRFERYFRRKGWFGFGQDSSMAEFEQAAESQGKSHTETVMEQWKRGDRKYEILLEVALAYAVTKALLPLRIIGSVWATPWFAGVLTRIRGSLTRKS